MSLPAGSAGPEESPAKTEASSWRLPKLTGSPAEAAQLGPGAGPPGKKQKTKTEAELLNQATVAICKLSLQSAQQVRQLAAACWSTFLIVSSASLVKACSAAGQAYNQAVKQKGKGHKLGSPHLHVLLALVEDTASDAKTPAELQQNHPNSTVL